jgi:5,10-methylenetetrahydrofolate reductase
MSGASSRNRVREALASGRFLISVECASPTAGAPFEAAIRPILGLARAIRNDPRIDALALTDRTRSDHDHDPIAIGHRVVDACGRAPIVHLAGKDRGPADLSERGYHTPLVAGLLFLTPSNGRRIRQADLPGVIITDDLAQKLDEEARAPDGGQAAAYRRLAFQIVGVRQWATRACR